MLGRTVLLLGLLISANLFAEPRQWDAGGMPVRAVSAIMDFTSVSRTDGTTLLVWAQSLGSEQVVLGQLLAPNGDARWEEGGRMVAQGDHKAASPLAVPVEGGWIISWLDQEQIASEGPTVGQYGIGTLRAIKIDDNGASLWAGGLAGIEVVPRQTQWWNTSHTLFASGGGAIITWDMMDHWAVKISANGQLEWPESVRLNMRLNTNQKNVASDLAGGLVFAWYQIIGGDTILFANKLLANGSFAWNDTAGVEVKRDNERFREIGVCSDGNGGMFVTWIRSNDLPEAFAQHVNSQGVASWAGGVPFVDLNSNVRLRSIAPSYANGNVDGAMAVYLDYDNELHSLVAQKVNLNGTQAWSANGNIVCVSESGNEYFSDTEIVSDRAGGLVCSYEHRDYSDSYQFQCRVVRIASDQTRPWGDNCGITVNEPVEAFIQVSLPTHFDNVVRIHWLESSYTSALLNAQRFSFDTGVPQYATPVELAVGDQQSCSNVKITKLNGGSTAIAWESETFGGRITWFQITDVFGTPMFGAEGRPLVLNTDGTPALSQYGALAADGLGGFFATFSKLVNGYYLLGMVHIDGQGNHISSPQGQVLEIPGAIEVDHYQVFCLADGTGGSYVTASMYDPEYYLVNATARVNSECEMVWDNPVIRDGVDHDIRTLSALPSENNSVLVAYSIVDWPDQRVSLMRVTADGQVVWDDSICAQDYSYSSSVGVCSDNFNGAYFVWEDRDDAADSSRAYAQRINPAGQRLWGENGMRFLNVEEWIDDFSCSADRLGNVTIAWGWYRDQFDIYAQRISAAGNILWENSGIALCEATADQYNPQVITMSDNEVYVIWQDDRNLSQEFWVTDIYGTHLNARGQIGDDSFWQTDGSPICNFDYRQDNFAAVADGAGGVTLAWLDMRTTFYWENSVFAQRLYDPIFTDADEKPEVVQEFSLSQNYPNPFNPETVIEFALPTSGQTTLKIFDITGREVTTLLNDQLTAGNHRVHFDGSQFASGVYFYTLRSTNQSLTRKMVLLK